VRASHAREAWARAARPVGIGIALLSACPPNVPDDDESPPDPVWDEFLLQREDFLRDLAVPISSCVPQDDTAWPAFHGCYDWHSAVHGTWSLLTISRLLDEPSYAAPAEGLLDPAAIEAELDLLQDGGPWPSEIPYGFSWFLTLAAERELQGQDDLAELADFVAAALEDYVASQPAAALDALVANDDYLNLSWCVWNLHAWALWTQDESLRSWVGDFAREEILPREDEAPLSMAPEQTEDFFPPALHRARLLLAALPAAEARDFIDETLPDDWSLEPLSEPATVHSAGLTFSRTWGLWALWRGTGDREIRRMYVEHVEDWMGKPEYWAEDYDRYAHWVAQFGVYGIARSYDE
jgi:hypothetical protein